MDRTFQLKISVRYDPQTAICTIPLTVDALPANFLPAVAAPASVASREVVRRYGANGADELVQADLLRHREAKL